jgi:hypothetical protein
VAAVQGIEDGDTIGTNHHGLAVDRERLGAQLAGCRGDSRISVSPIIAPAREQAHSRAVPTHDQPIAVVLDLVHPVGPGRGLWARDGIQGATNPPARVSGAANYPIEPMTLGNMRAKGSVRLAMSCHLCHRRLMRSGDGPPI